MKTHSLKQPESPIYRFDINPKIQEGSKEIESLRSEIFKIRKQIVVFENKCKEMVKNEFQYRSIIKSCQISLRNKRSAENPSKNPEKYSPIILQSLSEINENISRFDENVDELVTANEQNMISIYNSKLNSICKNLEKEKKEKFEYLEGLAEREKMLTKELEMLKESVEVIEEKNKALARENKEIKKKIQNKDLEILEFEKKIFEFKSNSIKYLHFDSKKNLDYSTRSQKQIKTNTLAIETEIIENFNFDRYQKMISHVQKLLDIENNNFKAAKNAFLREINYRSEVEDIIINTVDEVNRERNSRPTLFKRSYNMEIIEKLVKNESIISTLEEYVSKKNSKEKQE